MKIRKYSLILSRLLLILGISFYVIPMYAQSQITEEQTIRMRADSSNESNMPVETEDAGKLLRQIMSLITSLNESRRPGSENPSWMYEFDPPTQKIGRNLPPSEFGRENPFKPLMAEDTDRLVVHNSSAENNGTPGFDGKEPSIRLTAVFIMDGKRESGNKATIEENGVSRSVSVGDTVAGMEIIDIRRGEVVLGSETRKRKIKLGELFGANSDHNEEQSSATEERRGKKPQRH